MNAAENATTCDGSGQVWLGSQPYGSPGQSYAPCPGCPYCQRRVAERCAVCGGLHPGDITHTRCQ